MNIMVVGSGAREHALAWALQRGQGRHERSRVFCAPGNAGTRTIATNLEVDPENPAAVVSACREASIDLVVIGPEGPLAAGLVDALQAAGIKSFGPSRKAAALESSKAFARSFAERWGIPCAKTARFTSAADFCRYLDEIRGKKIVLKKSGLAAGKGVLESDDYRELLGFGNAVLEADELLAEEFLVGRELSIFALCSGSDWLVLPACADHKKAGTDDTGPNTGGMGAICPVPFAGRELLASIDREIVAPTFRGMEAEGLTYRGVLFFGVMVTKDGPRLLEYNVRFGDPETQSLLTLIDSDLSELLFGTATGALCSQRPRFSDKKACGVVVAAPGYPGTYPKNIAATLSRADAATRESQSTDRLLFHASTSVDGAGTVRTGGGRCFTAVGLGDDWSQARNNAYAMARAVEFEGAWFRPDIGTKALSIP